MRPQVGRQGAREKKEEARGWGRWKLNCDYVRMKLPTRSKWLENPRQVLIFFLPCLFLPKSFRIRQKWAKSLWICTRLFILLDFSFFYSFVDNCTICPDLCAFVWYVWKQKTGIITPKCWKRIRFNLCFTRKLETDLHHFVYELVVQAEIVVLFIGLTGLRLRSELTIQSIAL